MSKKPNPLTHNVHKSQFKSIEIIGTFSTCMYCPIENEHDTMCTFKNAANLLFPLIKLMIPGSIINLITGT